MSTTYTAKPPQVAVPTKVKMAVPAFSDVAKPANDVSCLFWIPGILRLLAVTLLAVQELQCQAR
jgi:hypothetical protein